MNPSLRTPVIITAVNVVLVASLSACSPGLDLPLPRLSRPTDATITILSGGNQTVKRGESLPQPVVVRYDTSGVPAQNTQLEFVVQGTASPGPNHTWFANTDQSGVASANGVVSNYGPGSATITVKHTLCVEGFKECTRIETWASAVTGLTITAP